MQYSEVVEKLDNFLRTQGWSYLYEETVEALLQIETPLSIAPENITADEASSFLLRLKDGSRGAWAKLLVFVYLDHETYKKFYELSPFYEEKELVLVYDPTSKCYVDLGQEGNKVPSIVITTVVDEFPF